MTISLRAAQTGRQALIAAGLFAVLLRAIEDGNFVEASKTRSRLASMGVVVKLENAPIPTRKGGGC